MQNSHKHIVLFDLDGTLTVPRGAITTENIDALRKLSKFAQIGIVTGSTFEYIFQQIPNDILVELDVLLFPCNGTEYHKFHSKRQNWEQQGDPVRMQDVLGQDFWRELNKEVYALQARLMQGHPELEYTSDFVVDRKSMINWCPIGRQAGTVARRLFEKQDNLYGIRNRYHKMIYRAIRQYGKDKIVIKLGGNTSFDIYPVGWDKTFVMRHFDKDTITWFVGDRCGPSGNDYEIYCHHHARNRGFKVVECDETSGVIDTIIKEISEFEPGDLDGA